MTSGFKFGSHTTFKRLLLQIQTAQLISTMCPLEKLNPIRKKQPFLFRKHVLLFKLEGICTWYNLNFLKLPTLLKLCS